MSYVVPGYVVPGYVVGSGGSEDLAGTASIGFSASGTISTTDQTFTDFEPSPSPSPTQSARVLLVELTGVDRVSGQPRTFYFSNRQFRTRPTDPNPNQPYGERVRQGLRMTRSIFDGRQITGDSRPDFGQIVLDNDDGGLDFLRNYAFDGRDLIVRLGEVGQTIDQFKSRFVGTARELQPSDTSLVIRARSRHQLLENRAQSLLYNGQSVAPYFDGVNDRVELPPEAAVADVEDFVVEAWFRAPYGVQSGGTLIHMGLQASWPQDRFTLYAASSVQSPYDGGIGVNWHDERFATSGLVLADGLEHHVAVAKRGRDFYVLLDGTVVIENAWSGATPRVITPDNCRLATALNTVGNTQRFEGVLYRTRFWEGSADADEVASRAFRPITGEETGLRAAYDLRESINLLDGITADVDGSGAFYDPSNRTDELVFDSAPVPAGAGYGFVQGAPEWVDVGGGRPEESGRRKIWAIGELEMIEPDTLDDRAGGFAVSSKPVRALEELSVGGLPLNPRPRLQLDGVAGLVTLPDNPAYDLGINQQRTLEIILRLEQSNATGPIMYADNTLSRLQRLAMNAGHFEATFTDSNGNSVTLTSAERLEGGVTYHLTVGFGGNGQPVQMWAGTGLAGSAVFPAAASGSFSVGATGIRLGHDGTSWLACDLELFRMTDRYLTPLEIAARQFKVVTDDSDVICQLEFQNGSGSTVTDTGSAANDGVISVSGATWLAADYSFDRVSGRGLLRTRPEGPLRARVSGWLPLGPAVGFDEDPANGTGMNCGSNVAFSASNSFSVECWFSHDLLASFGDRPRVVQKFVDTSTTSSWRLFYLVDDTTLRFELRTDAETARIDFVPTAGVEHHLGLVIDDAAKEVQLYIDCELVGTDTYTGNLGADSDAAELLFGGNGSTAVLAGGWVTECRFWSRTRTAAEIAESCRLQLTGLDQVGLEGLWRASEDEGTVVHDLSGNDRNATLVGDTHWTSGPHPTTAADITAWLAPLGGLSDDQVDSAAFASFTARTGEHALGTLVRDQTVSELFSELLQPDGYWTFDREGILQLGNLRAPDVGSLAPVPQEGGFSVLVDYDELRLNRQRDQTWHLYTRWFGAPRQQTGSVAWIFSKSTEYALRYDFDLLELVVEEYLPGDFLRTLRAPVDLTSGLWDRIAVRPVRGDVTVNGTPLVVSETLVSGPRYGAGAAISFGVGSGLDDRWNGLLADFSIYDRWISDNVLDGRAGLQLEGTENGLVAYLPMDDDEGDVFRNLAASKSLSSTPPNATRFEFPARAEYMPVQRRGVVEIKRSRITRIERVATVPPETSQTVAWSLNRSPLEREDLSALVTQNPNRIASFVRSQRLAEYIVPGVAAIHRLSEAGETRSSAHATAAGADAAARRHGLNRGRLREPFRIGVRGGLEVAAGGEIRLLYPRFEIPDLGRNFTVIEASEDEARNEHVLTVWG